MDEALWLPRALASALAEKNPMPPLASPWKSHDPWSVLRLEPLSVLF